MLKIKKYIFLSRLSPLGQAKKTLRAIIYEMSHISSWEIPGSGEAAG